MKIYVATPPTISVAAWLRRYATALNVVALVVLATLSVGVAQALYSNAAPRTIVSGTSVKTNVALELEMQTSIFCLLNSGFWLLMKRSLLASARSPAPAH